MVSIFITLLTAVMLGFLHALEVDHVLAVSAFVNTRPALGTAAQFGARWGLGHSITVLGLGGVLLLTGLRWPDRYDAIGQGMVGLMLLGLGLWALRASRKLHLHSAEEHGGHAHLHTHGGTGTHGHAHEASLPPDRPYHHAGGITLVGMLHGLSGTSAVVALVPVTMIHSVGLGFGYLVAFGVGVTVAMTLFAGIAAGAMRQAALRSLVWGRRFAVGIGVAGMLVGAWWIARAV